VSRNPFSPQSFKKHDPFPPLLGNKKTKGQCFLIILWRKRMRKPSLLCSTRLWTFSHGDPSVWLE
jgi:hypothetical protein